MKNRHASKPMVWGVVAGTESQHTLAWYFHRRLEKPLKLEEGEFLSRPETVHQPAHSPHLKTLLVQRKSAHHSHSRAWGQTSLVALRWNTSHHKAACKQNILLTGRLFSITEHALIHTTMHTAIAVVIAILFATWVPTVSAFAIAVINIGLNIGVICASHRLFRFHRGIML